MISDSTTAQALANFKPKFEFLVGIDSDGCAFDSMEIKHKECFCPNIIKFWGLQPVSKYAREAVEFVNLYSKWRGTNRWPALPLTLDLLRVRAEVIARHADVPRVTKVREFIASGKPLSNAGLKAYMDEHPDPELQLAMDWSVAVNDSIADMVHNLPPFPYVRECLEFLKSRADAIVVSQTPTEALVREWAENEIDGYVRLIAGQEHGTKKHHLKMAASGNYAPNHVLMIGDAPGDRDAARANNALFFPINPGHEEASWERLFRVGLDKFMTGQFHGAYEDALAAEFDALLPSTPPWTQETQR
ncbi:MAG: HAD hydrolase-like protein [Candidatus Acidiferrales bacterium]